jgi:hypothetical protein
VDILEHTSVLDVRNGVVIGSVWMYMRGTEGVEWVDERKVGLMGGLVDSYGDESSDCEW